MLTFHSVMTQPSVIYSSALKSGREAMASLGYKTTENITSRVILLREVVFTKSLEGLEGWMSVVCSWTFSFKVIPVYMKLWRQATATATDFCHFRITVSSHRWHWHWWLFHNYVMLSHYDPSQLLENICQLLQQQLKGPCFTSGFWISVKST